MTTAEKIDLLKLHKKEYASPKKPTLIETTSAVYLAIEGKGAPGGEAFTDSIGALYSMAFTIKMTRKFAGQQDYSVGKLETMYLHDDPNTCFASQPPEVWRWRLMIRTPEFITEAEVAKAAEALLRKSKTASIRSVHLKHIDEGNVLQMLHVGPYEKEGETVEIMEAFAAAQGYARAGAHHEIYISDPRRVAPEKLKTILRFPVRRR